jgi:hypothetical protein
MPRSLYITVPRLLRINCKRRVSKPLRRPTLQFNVPPKRADQKDQNDNCLSASGRLSNYCLRGTPIIIDRSMGRPQAFPTFVYKKESDFQLLALLTTIQQSRHFSVAFQRGRTISISHRSNRQTHPSSVNSSPAVLPVWHADRLEGHRPVQRAEHYGSLRLPPARVLTKDKPMLILHNGHQTSEQSCRDKHTLWLQQTATPGHMDLKLS